MDKQNPHPVHKVKIVPCCDSKKEEKDYAICFELSKKYTDIDFNEMNVWTDRLMPIKWQNEFKCLLFVFGDDKKIIIQLIMSQN